MNPQDREDIIHALKFVEAYYRHIEGDAPTEVHFVDRTRIIRERLEREARS